MPDLVDAGTQLMPHESGRPQLKSEGGRFDLAAVHHEVVTRRRDSTAPLSIHGIANVLLTGALVSGRLVLLNADHGPVLTWASLGSSNTTSTSVVREVGDS